MKKLFYKIINFSLFMDDVCMEDKDMKTKI